ncbi:TetR/AcrR family transcriptional regulator [Microbacterium sp. LEMMJ01]|uniref:TetR/AcrR family transcriptional regulator n=1 Tax=Microbacterium sp. LEMMJ01 TaxID=1978350 RepID=UPI000A1DECCE|nr:TetR family transcriptional regulator [Microbacterium sp. LEMMJ01]OSP07315.1 TetR family transcriptional regulator [Microbacterium sp. LEMMJ01]
MPTKSEILDASLDVLRQGEPLTLDSAARAAGLTKPGLVHHFRTKEVLTVAVVDHLLDKWERELRLRLADDTPSARTRAYVDWALTGSLDAADLAVLTDPRLRDKLTTLWEERMTPWFGEPTDPRMVAVRLMADGAWLNRSFGMLQLPIEDRDEVLALADGLLAEEVSA